MDDVVPVPTLTEFAGRQQLALTRFAYMLCGDRQRAEDLVQDVFTAVFRKFGDAVPVREPVAYVRSAITNAYLGRRRLRSSSERPVADPPADSHPGSESVVAGRDLVWRALDHLPPRQRAVLVLRYYLDLPDAEIARVLGCRLGTVSSAASRGLGALRLDPSLAFEEGGTR